MKAKKIYSIPSLGENIKVIVITGGPCSGKTTGMAMLNSMLADRGYKVLISPESATKLINAGLSSADGLTNSEFQEEILLDILDQEDRMFSIAKKYRDKGKKVIVLCDRGTMDCEAYIGEKGFTKMIKDLGYTHRDLCDNRYHAVIHLRSTAVDAEEFYTLSNNTARKESINDAKKLDKLTLEAWIRHQHPRIIGNKINFEQKIKDLFVEVCEILGDPVPLEKEDKFLVKSFNLKKIPVKWSESLITQDYLISPDKGAERRVRSRGENGAYSYYYTIKKHLRPGVRVEQERVVTKKEYNKLLIERNPKKTTIRKKRICFFWKEQFFEVDVFIGLKRKLILMEAERTDIKPDLDLPPFIKISRNVTGDRTYSNSSIAEGKIPV